MGRISRVSSLRANRVRSNYVNRMNAPTVSQVEAVAPIAKGKNDQNRPSENYLDSYDYYYKKLDELKLEFKKFYHHEKELQQAIQQLEEHQQHLVTYTDDLIYKYNQALRALYSFDLLTGSSHFTVVRDVFHSFRNEMELLGIDEDERGYLSFDPASFVHYIKKEPEHFETILVNFKTFIIEAYRTLTKVKITTSNNPYEKQTFNYKGLIIEEET